MDRHYVSFGGAKHRSITQFTGGANLIEPTRLECAWLFFFFKRFDFRGPSHLLAGTR